MPIEQIAVDDVVNARHFSAGQGNWKGKRVLSHECLDRSWILGMVKVDGEELNAGAAKRRMRLAPIFEQLAAARRVHRPKVKQNEFSPKRVELIQVFAEIR